MVGQRSVTAADGREVQTVLLAPKLPQLRAAIAGVVADLGLVASLRRGVLTGFRPSAATGSDSPLGPTTTAPPATCEKTLINWVRPGVFDTRAS